MKHLLSALLILASIGFATADGAKGPLAALPSKPGPHIEKVKALGDNAWLNLGTPAADPKWGKARGRSWSSNMPFAPALRGGFVFAEGVHGYTKPDGRYMNDVWFYDANAAPLALPLPRHRGEDGREADQGQGTHAQRRRAAGGEGRPAAPAAPDPRLRLPRLRPGPAEVHDLRQPSSANYFTTGKGGVFEEANRLFEEERKGKKFPGLSPFFYDAATGKFECFAVQSAPKGQPYGANVLAYVASKKQFFYGGTDGVWFLDPEKRAWVDAKPKGSTAGRHRPLRRLRRQARPHLLPPAQRQAAEDNFLIYDVKANAWSRPKPKGTGPVYSTSYESVFNFDAAADRLVVIRLYTSKDEPGLRRGVYVYDPEVNAWEEPLPLAGGRGEGDQERQLRLARPGAERVLLPLRQRQHRRRQHVGVPVQEVGRVEALQGPTRTIRRNW